MMRNWKMALLLASALMAGPALAQDHGDHGHGGDHGGGHDGGHGPQGPHGGPPGGQPHGPPPGGPGGGQPHFPTAPGGLPGGQGGYRGPLPGGGVDHPFPTGPGRAPGGQGGYRGPLPGHDGYQPGGPNHPESPSHPSGYQPGGPNHPDSPSHPSGYQPGGPNRPVGGEGGFDPGRHVGGQPQGGVNVWRDQHGGPGYDGHGGGFDGRPGGDPHGYGGDHGGQPYRGGPGGDPRGQGYRGDHGGDWNRGWRDDHRYDWQGWRQSHGAAFRVGRYNPPGGYGWGYRRFDVGVAIPSVFFAENYWIGDPGYYRLPPAYGPYRWVRYYNDALLIDIYQGTVVDVIPDFFW